MLLYMTTYLDLLPDDLYIKIYEEVNRNTLKEAAFIGNRRNIPKQGVKTNHNVIWHWLNNRSFKSLSMRTNGKDLYSYNLKIGYTENSNKILLDYTADALGYHSHTTSHHVNMARVYADKVISEGPSNEEWAQNFIV
eukprot:SAG31_NODE_9434_length_1277_cov_4.087436_2_plen_137_part_00